MIATFAFKSRTKFSVQFVWDLSTTFRDLNAVTVQLKTGKCLKIKEWLSGLQMPGDIRHRIPPIERPYRFHFRDSSPNAASYSFRNRSCKDFGASVSLLRRRGCWGGLPIPATRYPTSTPNPNGTTRSDVSLGTVGFGLLSRTTPAWPATSTPVAPHH